jgi:lipopolysaccharide/colanic/teichoic acid biosynthesis glycosyltransferase
MFLHSTPTAASTDAHGQAVLDAAFLRPAHLGRSQAMQPVPAASAMASAAPAVTAAAPPARSAAAAPLPALPGRARPALPERPGGGLYRAGLKRFLDVAVILLSAPIVAPLVALLALLVARDGGRPFYVQERVGRGGRTYRMWKLRTMVPDADACLEACLKADPSLRAEWDSKQKLIRDPRITSIGRMLRKCSMDELPQLWNVLRGDMSLVGPRPMMVSQRALYPGEDYYELRPGITGPWQISHRNRSSFADRAKFDRLYNRRLSLRTDLRILLATVRTVIHGTGH